MPLLGPRATSTEAATRKLRAEILLALKEKRLKAGDRVLSERKFAARLGVSYMTARKALGVLVGEGLLERHPRQGVFVGLGATRNVPARRKLKRVRGLFYLELFSGFYGQMAAALTHALAEAGVEITWSTAAELMRPELRERLSEKREDAFVVVGQMPPDLLAAIRVSGAPITVVDHTYAGLPADCALLDNEGVGFAAAERFFSRERRRVAYLGGEMNPKHPQYAPQRRAEWPNSVFRSMGVRRAYVERGLPIDEKLFCAAESLTRVRALAADWFAPGSVASRPDAVLCFDASAAVILIEAALASGLRVPEDFAVLATGGPPEWATPRISLAHYNVDWEALGREAARLCLAREAEPAAPPRRVVVPWSFVPGQSAGQ